MSDDAVREYGAIIEAARPDIEAALKEKLVEEIVESMRWKVRDVLAEQVSKFVTEEIAPKVGEYLTGEKQAILDAILEASKGIAVDLAKSLHEQAAENLSSSWSAKKVIKALFE